MNDIAKVTQQPQAQVSTPVASSASKAPQVQVQTQAQAQTQAKEPQNLVADIQDASKVSTKVNSKAQVQNLVDDLNKAMAPMNTNLKFGVDSQDIFYVSVIESETSKMIRRFPAEEAADFLPKMQEVTGMLFDTKG